MAAWLHARKSHFQASSAGWLKKRHTDFLVQKQSFKCETNLKCGAATARLPAE